MTCPSPRRRDHIFLYVLRCALKGKRIKMGEKNRPSSPPERKTGWGKQRGLPVASPGGGRKKAPSTFSDFYDRTVRAAFTVAPVRAYKYMCIYIYLCVRGRDLLASPNTRTRTHARARAHVIRGTAAAVSARCSARLRRTRHRRSQPPTGFRAPSTVGGHGGHDGFRGARVFPPLYSVSHPGRARTPAPAPPSRPPSPVVLLRALTYTRRDRHTKSRHDDGDDAGHRGKHGRHSRVTTVSTHDSFLFVFL